MAKFILGPLLVGLLFSSFAYSQEDSAELSREEYLGQFMKPEDREKLKAKSPPKTPQELQENHPGGTDFGPGREAEKIDQVMEEHKKNTEQLTQILKKFGGDAKALQQVQGSGGQVDMQALQELLAKNQAQGSAPLMPQMADMLKKNAPVAIFNSLAPFRQMGLEKSKDLLSKGQGRVPAFLKQNPKALDFAGRLMTHPQALPEISKIMVEKTRLYIFIGVNVFLFVLGFLWKRMDSGRLEGTVQRLAAGLKRTSAMMLVRGATFLGFFHQELGPFWSVFKKSFLG